MLVNEHTINTPEEGNPARSYMNVEEKCWVVESEEQDV